MGFPAPSKLFFVAAALFLGVAAMGFAEKGLEPRSLIGMAMAGAMVRLGIKIRPPR